MKILKKLGKKIKKEFDKRVFSSVLKKIDDLSLTTLDSRRRNYFFKYNLSDFELKHNEISFIHTPKTGGFSIGSIMQSSFKNNSANITFRNLDTHAPVSLISSPSEYKYITFIREPVERVYSYYRQILHPEKGKNENYHDLANKGLVHLLQNCWEVRNLYCQYFSGFVYEEINEKFLETALKNLKNFYFVGNFHNFENEARKLIDLLHLDCQNIPHLNKENWRTEEKFEIPNKDRKLIQAYNYFDIKLYNSFIKHSNW